MNLEESLRRQVTLLAEGMIYILSASDFLPPVRARMASQLGMTGDDGFGIGSEKFFERLRIPAGDYTNRIRRPEAFRSFPEILPKVG